MAVPQQPVLDKSYKWKIRLYKAHKTWGLIVTAVVSHLS